MHKVYFISKNSHRVKHNIYLIENILKLFDLVLALIDNTCQSWLKLDFSRFGKNKAPTFIYILSTEERNI